MVITDSRASICCKLTEPSAILYCGDIFRLINLYDRYISEALEKHTHMNTVHKGIHDILTAFYNKENLHKFIIKHKKS